MIGSMACSERVDGVDGYQQKTDWKNKKEMGRLREGLVNEDI